MTKTIIGSSVFDRLPAAAFTLFLIAGSGFSQVPGEHGAGDPVRSAASELRANGGAEEPAVPPPTTAVKSSKGLDEAIEIAKAGLKKAEDQLAALPPEPRPVLNANKEQQQRFNAELQNYLRNKASGESAVAQLKLSLAGLQASKSLEDALQTQRAEMQGKFGAIQTAMEALNKPAPALPPSPKTEQTLAAQPVNPSTAELPVVSAPSKNLTALLSVIGSMAAALGLALWFNYVNKKSRRELVEHHQTLSGEMQERTKQITAAFSKKIGEMQMPASTPPAVSSVPAEQDTHLTLSLTYTVPLDTGDLRQRCKDIESAIALITETRARMYQWKQALANLPAHRAVAGQILRRFEAGSAAPLRQAWQKRCEDALATGLLYDPELLKFGKNPEQMGYHLSGRFTSEVLALQISPLLVAMEEFRHLDRFVQEPTPEQFSTVRSELENARKQILAKCDSAFKFRVEYVPLFAPCDYKALQITKIVVAADLPEYYKAVACLQEQVRGVIRYGNYAVGITPETKTELIVES